MSKTFIVVCIIIVLVSFAVSCFLMSIVNPPPLKKRVHHDTKISSQASQRRSEDNELSSNPLESLTPFYRFNPSSLTAGINNVTSVEEDDDDDPIFNFPLDLIKKVIPPLYPLRFTPTTRTTTHEILTTQLNKIEDSSEANESLEANETEIPTISNSDFISSPVAEKGLRRSVTNFLNKIVDANSSSVIIKIIDKYGQPRIEIKINTDYSSAINDDPFKTGSHLEMIVKRNNSRDEIGELAPNTAIKILPNNTVIVDSNDDPSDSESIVTTYINEKESETTDKSTKFSFNSESNKILPSKIVAFDSNDDFFYNKTIVATGCTKSKVTNKSTIVTFPITDDSTDVNIDEKQITKDELQMCSFKPNFRLEKMMVNKSDVIKSTTFLDLENNRNRFEFITNIKNDTKKSILQFRSKVRNDAKKDVEIEKYMANKSDAIKIILLPDLKNHTFHRVDATSYINNDTKKNILQLYSKINKNPRKNMEMETNVGNKSDEIKNTVYLDLTNHKNIPTGVIFTTSSINNATAESILEIHSKIKSDAHKNNNMDIKKNMANELHAIRSTVFLDMKNHTNRRADVESSINNVTAESILQSHSKTKKDAKKGDNMKSEKNMVNKSNLTVSASIPDLKKDTKEIILNNGGDVREDIETANLGIVKDAENKSNTFQEEIIEKNKSIESKNLSKTTSDMKNFG